MMSGMTGAERAEVMVRMKFGPNHGITFSPDGALLAVCSAHHVEVIDARSRRVLRLIRGHAGTVADVAFSPDGTVIVTGSYIPIPTAESEGPLPVAIYSQEQ